MFDYIGLVLGFLALLALSIGAGLVVAALTVLVFWSRWRRAIPLGIGAVILAPLCVIWLFATVALLPGESLFGDIDQPLPNGYRVSALGKMPDFADISSANGADGLSEYVASLQVQGDLVVGQYSHPFGTFTPKPNEGYFLLDTRSGAHLDLPSTAVLQAKLHQPLQLVPVPQFQSDQSSARLKRAVSRTIIVGPIAAAWLLYIAAVIALRFFFAARMTSRQHSLS